MPISQRGGSPSKPWLADYYDHEGARRQISCATPIDARIEILANGGPKSAKDVKETTVEELFEYVWTSRAAKSRPGNVDISRLQARRHLLPVIGHLQVRRVHKGHLAAILTAMEKSLSEATAGNMVTYLVTNFDVAVHRGCVRDNVARAAYAGVARGGPRRSVEEPLKADVDKLLTTASGWVRVMLALFTEAGLTPPEAAGLTWECVDLEAGTVRIDRRVRKHMVVPFVGDRLARTVPMTPVLRRILGEWREDLESGARMVLHPDGCLRGWVTLGQPLAHLQVGLGMIAPRWRDVPAWSLVDGEGPKYAQLQFRLVAAGRWHREGKSLKELAALLGLRRTNQLIPIVRALADDLDLALIASIDAAMGNLLETPLGPPETRSE